MYSDIHSLMERFDEALAATMHNLGPQLIQRASIKLTPGQLFMLHYIQREENCNLSQLADKMHVSPSAITIMLDRMESHGLVLRRRDDTDRRVVNAEVTQAGNDIINRVWKMRTEVLQHCLSQFQADELNTLVQSLERLARVSATVDVESIIERDEGLEG